jgi:hypothetical protein
LLVSEFPPEKDFEGDGTGEICGMLGRGADGVVPEIAREGFETDGPFELDTSLGTSTRGFSADGDCWRVPESSPKSNFVGGS